MRPYLRVANVFDARVDLSDVMEMNFTPHEYEVYQLRPGDILLNEGQSLEWVGRAAMYRGEPKGSCFQNTLIRFRASPAVLPEFALIVFRHYLYSQRFRRVARWTTNIAHLGSDRFAEMEFPLPPLQDQERIVAETDRQLTRLNAGVEALRRLQAHLRRYRAAVLNDAFEGKLVKTEAALARETNRTFENGHELLARVLRERPRAWEDWVKRTGKRRTKYAPPEHRPTGSLAPLPDGWCWATWDQIGFSQNGRAFPSSDYADTGVRLLRPGNLHVSGRVVWTSENARRLPVRYADEFREFLVGPEELVMNLTAQSLKDEFLGRICMTGPQERVEPCLLNQRQARLSPIFISPRFMFWLFKSKVFRRYVDGLNTGSLIQHMFTSQLSQFALPLPPLSEQDRIVAALEQRMTEIDTAEQVVERSVTRARRLRPAILQAAFEGRLVPADHPVRAPAA